MQTPTVTELLLTPILAADPAGPRITYYDDSTGERVELSAVTLANWAAKTANLLRDEFGLSPGGVVAVGLPAHWQTAAVLLGAWWAGAEVVLGGDDEADVALVTAEGIDSAAADEVVALSLDAFGKPVPNLSVAVTDYATSVRVHGDQFVPTGTGAAALDGIAVGDLMSAARDVSVERNWSPTDRILSTMEWSSAGEMIDGLLSVLIAGSSLVQVRRMDESARARRIVNEKITVTL